MELNLQQKTGEIVAVLEQRFVIFWKNLLLQFFLQCLAKISRVFNFLYGCFNLYEDTGGRSVRDRLDPKLSAVLDDEYELNARRRHGETLVHDAVRNERLDCLIELLLSGADLEISDDEGNAPLHTAVQLNNPHLVYALIAFNAYVNVKNHSGQTPRHIAAQHEEKGADILCALHSMGADRCKDNMADCYDGCRCQGYYDGLPQEPQFDISDELEKVYDPFLEMTISSLREQAEKNPPKKGEARRAETVLCLDGGGIRGLVLVLILEAIERASDKRIVDSFDWIVGTSAGAVLATSLLHGYSLLECRRIYFDFKNELFHGSKPYDGERFVPLVKRMTRGTEARIKDLKYNKNKLLITTTIANRSPPALHFFRNFEAPVTSSTRIVSQSGNFKNPPPEDSREELAWRCIRASCSAPTYFTPFQHYLDGGLFCNNPTNDAITEIIEYNMSLQMKGEKPPPLGAVISVGSGSAPVRGIEEISDVFPRCISDIYRALQMLTTASNLCDIVLQTLTDTRFRPVDRSRAWCQSIGAAFFRLSPTLSKDYELCLTDNEEIVRMLWETKVYLHRNKGKFDTIGELLNKI